MVSGVGVHDLYSLITDRGIQYLDHNPIHSSIQSSYYVAMMTELDTKETWLLERLYSLNFYVDRDRLSPSTCEAGDQTEDPYHQRFNGHTRR